MSQEIKTAVETILGAVGTLGIVVSFKYVCENDKALDGTHAMDEWRCTIQNHAKSEQFAYFTGLGLRAEATPAQKREAEYGFQGLTVRDKQGATSYGRRYLAAVQKLRKPKAPHAADILHCLLLDSVASGQSFAEWCSDFGYDTDSRKAYAAYEDCQQNTDKLNRVIDRATQTALREALQDY